MSTSLKQKGVKEPAGINNKLNPGTRASLNQYTEGKSRLEARIPRNVHAQIKRAAEIQGRTLTDFVVYAALEAATKAIEENSVIQLSIEGQNAFAEALLNPPEPNAALRRAFESHATLFCTTALFHSITQNGKIPYGKTKVLKKSAQKQ